MSWIDRLRNLRVPLSPYTLYYPFNSPKAAVDPDWWTAAGDAGGFTVITDDDEPPSRKLYADTAGDNDYYIHGDGIYGRLWNFQSSEYSKVIFEARLKFASVADVKALWGFVKAGSFPTDYAEPVVDSAIFFLDNVTPVSANFVCRTYDAAEQETASDVVADTSYHTYKITWTADRVIFEIDGVVKATHETQIPDTPMGLVFLIRTNGAYEKAVNIEYVKVDVS